MMMLVIGGSGSGKSSYAEACAEKCAAFLSQTGKEERLEENRKYYLATMQVFDNDAEGQKKIERHRRLRSGKGFVTIEQPTDILKAFEKIKSREITAGTETVLLECVLNLTANEMFSGEIPEPAERVSAKITEEIRQLNQSVANLIVVSGNVFEDGIVYDGATMEYIRALGSVNQALAAMADCVAEVTSGIPLMIKPRTDVLGPG